MAQCWVEMDTSDCSPFHRPNPHLSFPHPLSLQRQALASRCRPVSLSQWKRNMEEHVCCLPYPPIPRCSFRKYSKTPINVEPQMCWRLRPSVSNQPVRWLKVVDVVVHHPLEKIELGKAELFHRSPPPRPTQTHPQTHPRIPLNSVDQSSISTATIISHRSTVYPPATTFNLP